MKMYFKLLMAIAVSGLLGLIALKGSQTNQINFATLSILVSTNPAEIMFEISTNDELTWQKLRPIKLNFVGNSICTVTTNIPLIGIQFIRFESNQSSLGLTNKI